MKRTVKTLKCRLLAALILVIASRAGLAQEAQPSSPAPPQGTILEREDAVVLASEFFYNPRPGAAEIWQPSASDIARLESLLPDFMRGQKTLPYDYQPLNEYFRQYVGIVRNGKKFIGINLVHLSFFETMAGVQSLGSTAGDLRKSPVIVDDGGAYFFHLKFDPATGAFSDLRFNGYA